ncbi:hypothetical protein Asphe3_20500 [Pseudarthrobacter phenanthrenivorans Sphe3]|uniref:Uncharacterized protein n=1 Tax=Pseudarthrobacter phenanthrenivorans (strain DSM 18606 / JCM 16027 / LMG 23796 / Sphe3) TaxID=930171 RepID=F0M2J5_PSEPM|nr:hypothetical protein [Pseudarthrobacter phenanthrenivorans]ADX73205.1 hypothetical protein Asphe3_20500 [Pseudarthrobacter phenanthrenivorans Sphe3]
MFRKLVIPGSIVLASMAMLGSPATAAPPSTQLSGAIFTTDASGNPVNLNIYDSKEDVYLNGGPGINAPKDAAGLPAGTYSFQVTDPSGETLLSTDPVACRQFTVDASGVITSNTVSGACAHVTGTSTEDGGLTVQLFPYNDTPNNGGVYKVWVSPTNLLDCSAPSARHCFVPRYSKTDNFKVRHPLIVEIDVRFWKNGVAMDGYAAHWTDTNGASNTKYSEWNPAVLAFHEAHFEAVEPGTHGIRVNSQPGCTIVSVQPPAGKAVNGNRGWANVSVTVADHAEGDHTYFVDVTCA